MKIKLSRIAASFALALLVAPAVFADGGITKGEVMTGYDKRFVDTAGRIYTLADPAAAGGIEGRTLHAELTHAIAIDHERLKVFRGDIEGGDKKFRFHGLPVGKYDLVLVTKDGAVYEGLDLGESPDKLPPASKKNIDVRVGKQEAFFNRYILHRAGIVGDRCYAFVERMRDNPTVKQSGEKLNANVRRLEVITLDQASDDWQQIDSRHIYREPEKMTQHPPFLRHAFVAELGSIRVVDSVKQLGILNLPKN